MADLFLILFLISFICLILGLIRPSIFNRFIKGEATRKKVGLTFGIAMIAFFILFGVIGEPAEKTEELTLPEAEEIIENINLSVNTNLSNNILQVSGSANLPDGALITYEVSHEEWGTKIFLPDEIDKRFAEGTTEIKNGKYEFSVNIEQWPSGSIETWVAFQTILGTTVSQPKEVIELYGELGEKIPDASAIQVGPMKRVEKISTVQR